MRDKYEVILDMLAGMANFVGDNNPILAEGWADLYQKVGLLVLGDGGEESEEEVREALLALRALSPADGAIAEALLAGAGIVAPGRRPRHA